MMHFIKILFLEQFLISSPCLFGNYNRFVQLFLQTSNLVLYLFTLLILNWDFFTTLYRHSSLLQLVPFLLKVIQSVVHLVLDEKVTQKQVNSLPLQLSLDITSLFIEIQLQNCCLVVEINLSISNKSFSSTRI